MYIFRSLRWSSYGFRSVIVLAFMQSVFDFQLIRSLLSRSDFRYDESSLYLHFAPFCLKSALMASRHDGRFGHHVFIALVTKELKLSLLPVT